MPLGLGTSENKAFCEQRVGWEIVVCVPRSWRSDALSRKPASSLRAALAEGEGIAKASSERVQVAFPAGAATAAGFLVATAVLLCHWQLDKPKMHKQT